MTFKREPKRLAAALAAVALIAAACGDDDDGTSADTSSGESTPTETDATSEPSNTGDTTPGASTPTSGGGDFQGECETANDQDDSVKSLSELDFSGIEMTVGSKNFTEQYVLGWLTVVALEEGGAKVNEQIDLGGTNVVREALLSGQIDASWEYNGTGWSEHLGNTEPPSFVPEELTDAVCTQDLEANEIRWIGRSPFNNTYGFASRPDLVADDGEPFDFQGMADYLAENPDAMVCMESEFPNRRDGLVLFEESTGYPVPSNQQQILETNVIYDETAQGNCDFGEIFTTDERVELLDLNLVEDPGVMILYNASLTMSDELYQQAPEAFEALADTLTKGLDNATMLELNGRAASGEDPEKVARDYLTQEGLIKG